MATTRCLRYPLQKGSYANGKHSLIEIAFHYQKREAARTGPHATRKRVRLSLCVGQKVTQRAGKRQWLAHQRHMPRFGQDNVAGTDQAGKIGLPLGGIQW